MCHMFFILFYLNEGTVRGPDNCFFHSFRFSFQMKKKAYSIYIYILCIDNDLIDKNET